MLEQAEQRRESLLASSASAADDGVPARAAGVLARLPEIVRGYLGDLEALLADRQIERGKQILAALDTAVRLHPTGRGLEVEVTGKLEGVFRLLQGQIRWLGDQDSNLDSQIQSLMAYH